MIIWPKKWLSDSANQSMSIIGLRNNPYGILPSVMVMSISLLKLKRVDSSSHLPLLQLICVTDIREHDDTIKENGKAI